jgi:hypothetical protein
VLHHAEPRHRKVLTRLLDLWEHANADWFGDVLVPPHILMTEPSSSKAGGDTSSVSAWGSTLQIRLRPSIWTGTHRSMREGAEFEEGRLRFLEDIALHETVHQYQLEIARDPEDSYHGHGPHFRDHCNRIGRDLGLPPVRTAKKRGSDRDLPSCAHWPICVRDPDYYLGAYVPPGGDTDEEEQPIEPLDVVAREIAHLLAVGASDRWNVMLEVLREAEPYWVDGFVEELRLQGLLPDVPGSVWEQHVKTARRQQR